jgi:hypothetical protein
LGELNRKDELISGRAAICKMSADLSYFPFLNIYLSKQKITNRQQKPTDHQL